MAPKMYRYVSRRPYDGEVRVRLRALANERRRFGYRRLHILLAREGHRLNHKKLFRLYQAERLGVRRRGGRKRALGTRAPMAVPQRKNQRWSLDFVSDALACGERFRVLAVVDDTWRTKVSPSCPQSPALRLARRTGGGPHSRPRHESKTRAVGMTSPGNASRWWRTPRCRGCALGVSSIGSWRSAAVRR
jgi:putative transposase